MKNNTFYDKLRAGAKPIQSWMWSPSPLAAEIAATAGFDSVALDLQHGPADFNVMWSILASVAAAGSTPMVRVPANDRAWITRTLDSGAMGIICPDVRTVAEAEEFVKACLYAPSGERGYGPVRQIVDLAGGGGQSASAYASAARAGVVPKDQNANVLVVVQIESPAGLDNVEQIMALPGIDGVFPGMVDYALLETGEVVADLRDPRIRQPLLRIIKAAHDHGKYVGLPGATSEEMTFAVEELGADWIQSGNDVGWLVNGAKRTLAEARAVVAQYKSEEAKKGEDDATSR